MAGKNTSKAKSAPKAPAKAETAEAEVKTEAASEETPAPKKRGAPKGVKRGPRQLFHVVQGVKSGEPFMDSIPSVTSEEAQAKFEEIHSTKAVGSVLGPFYEQKGKGASKSSVSIDVNDLKFTGMTQLGQHRGWNCRVMLTQDKTIGFAVYTDPVNPEEVTSARSKPQPRAIHLRDIENLVDAK